MVAWFAVGALECLLLCDGGGGLPAEAVLANATPAERGAAFGDRLEPDGRVMIPYNCLLVRAGERIVLVDAGIGRYGHPCGGSGGRLEDELRRAGVAPGDIDVVVVTHGHLDHIGGLCRDGHPRFAGARHVVSRVEWEWWIEDGRLTESGTVGHDQIPPLMAAGLLERVDERVEVADGVLLVLAPGHTPGQLAVELGGAAIYLADAIVDELHVEHPGWTMEFDEDPAVTVETRLRLLGRAADEGLMVVAAHLVGRARVERAGEGFRLVPSEAGG